MNVMSIYKGSESPNILLREIFKDFQTRLHLESVTMRKYTNVALRKAFKVRVRMVELRGPTSNNKKIGNTVEVSYTETRKNMKNNVIMNTCYRELKTNKYINC